MNKYKYVLLLLLFVIVSCSPLPERNIDEQNKLTVYTSIYPLQFITEQIGKEHVTVYSIYPPGVDAHTYEPTSKTLTRMAQGDAFIYIGGGMEGFAESAVNALQNHSITFIAMSEHENLFLTDDQGHDIDPHLWLDPIRMIDMSEIIKKQLTKLEPNQADIFERNFLRLQEQLLQLHDDFNEMAQCFDDKTIVVTHAAYNYWTERYGIEQIPISGISPGEEPSQKKLAQLARTAQKQGIDYIIFEQHNHNDRIATIIQEHLHADKLIIHNLETLTEYDIKNNENYLSLMYKNIEIIKEALNKERSDKECPNQLSDSKI